MFHYNGKPAIGLAIAMNDGGNIQEFGKQLQQRIEDLTAELPVGVACTWCRTRPRWWKWPWAASPVRCSKR
jgi:multidrug efflux pump subunit AcrB